MTNYDNIKNMSIDELAEFFLDIYFQSENLKANFNKVEYIKQCLNRR